MFYFNFSELQQAAEDQIPAIFVLVVGLSLVYNNYRFNNLIDFRYKCYPMLDIPYVLSKKKLIRKNFYKELEMTYRTKELQNYCRNPNFLKFNCDISKKVQYIKLLSYRNLGNTNNWIPLDYIDDVTKIQHNELLSIQDNKIHFTYEGKTNVNNNMG